MWNRLTYEEANKTFTDRGYILLENEYRNTNTKMRYKCPKHPNETLYIKLRDLKSGKGCWYCARERNIKSRKFSFPEVKEEFKKRGYILLENEYINSITKMKFRCPYHPEKDTSIRLSDLKSGYGCLYCGRERTTKAKVKKEINQIKKEFKRSGCELLENEYINSKAKMKFKCKKHPNLIQHIDYQHFKKGMGCVYCSKKKVYIDYQQIKKEFEAKGLILLEEDCKGLYHKMRYKCKKHQEYIQYKDYAHFKRGTGCVYCYHDSISGSKNKSWKGGITTISNFLRDRIKEWKYNSLKYYNFKCAITNAGQNLQVHHTKSFHAVRDEVFSGLNINISTKMSDYNDEELEVILNAFLKKHDEVAGVPLTKRIHKLFHSVYGYETTTEDLWDFKARYLAGEFNDNKDDYEDQQISFVI